MNRAEDVPAAALPNRLDYFNVFLFTAFFFILFYLHPPPFLSFGFLCCAHTTNIHTHRDTISVHLMDDSCFYSVLKQNQLFLSREAFKNFNVEQKSAIRMEKDVSPRLRKSSLCFYQHFKPEHIHTDTHPHTHQQTAGVRRGNAMYIVALFHNKRGKNIVLAWLVFMWQQFSSQKHKHSLRELDVFTVSVLTS